MANILRDLFTRNAKLTVDQLIVKKTVISFSIFIVLIISAFIGLRSLFKQPPTADGTRAPLRKVLKANDAIFQKLLSDNHKTKEYPVSMAVKNVRVNGDVGLKGSLDTASWRMYVIRKNGDTLKLQLSDLQRLPKTEIVYNFKCIEGWSQITYWGGVKFSDFIKAYGLEEEATKKYLGLSTPDKEYFVGIDMPSAMHPQTLLCYELNGKLLPLKQGYPLRLIIPVKYGVKSLKRIGTMFFDDNPPPDYWAKKGYDYFLGL